MLPAIAFTYVIVLTGCAPSAGGSSSAPTDSATPSTVPSPTTDCADELRTELLGMLERDQAGRMGDDDPEGDQARTERLQQIIAECGWPATDRVGDDGGEAAWAIAQHSDLDPAFQEEALALISEAAEDGQASPGDVAYLEDRVRAGKGEPQKYGTQIACVDGELGPANGWEDASRVDELRAEAGLEPLEEYYASFGDDPCAGSG